MQSSSLAYKFEEKQELKLKIYDSDSDKGDLSKKDKLGRVIFSLGQAVGASGGRLEFLDTQSTQT